MSASIVSSSSDSTDRAIDEYQDSSSFSGSSDSSNESSKGGFMDEEYISGVPGIPLEALQEQLRKASGSRVGTSSNLPSSNPTDEEEIVYSCTVGIHSKTSEQRLSNLKTWYQIPNDFNPRLAVRGEWCCNPCFGIGVYEAYFLGGLRFPLNSFARELLVRLGLGVCQFNPNAWRLIISMQILWNEVFGRDRPLTVEEFLFCYKPSKISQSLGFHQFTARSRDCRLIKSLALSDRNWKTEFIFVSGFWSGNPVEVGRDPFAPYTGELGNLRPESVKRPSLSKFHRDRVHRARLHSNRNFRSLVNLRNLFKWGFGPNPSDEAIAHEITVRKRMATLKENKGKDVVVKEGRPETQAQPRPTVGEKRKTISKNLNLGSLPSCRGKKGKHDSSQVVKSKPLSSQQPTPIFDVDSSTPVEVTPSKTPLSKTTASPSSHPSQRAPSNIIENEDLAWERFQNAVTDEDVNTCYDMSLKDFEHSGVHDLFKAMSKFIAASRQATGLDKTRILLETRIKEVNDESKKWAGVATKAKEELKEAQNLVEELRADAVEKDTRLDHMLKKNDELSILLTKAKEDAVTEFKVSKEYTDLLDANYAAGFEDFILDAKENFPEVDFSIIKLNLNAATSSLLQTGSEDANIEDDATTLPPQDASNVNAPQT